MEYAAHLTIDLATLVLHVSGPNGIKVSTPLLEVENHWLWIRRAYPISCTNSCASNLIAVATIVCGWHRTWFRLLHCSHELSYVV